MTGNAQQTHDAASGADRSEGTFDVCFVRKGEFVTREIAGETLVVPVRGRKGDLESIYNLNEVGCFIWNSVDGQTTVRDLAARVCFEFDIGLEAAQQDTLQFVAALQDAGLIEPKPGTKD